MEAFNNFRICRWRGYSRWRSLVIAFDAWRDVEGARDYLSGLHEERGQS